MKTNLKYMAIGLFALATAFTSCRKDEIVPQAVGTTIEMRNSISQGVWEVGKFNEDGVDETQKFDNFLFEFRPNGELIAIRMGESFTGSWWLSGSESSNKLNISFGETEPLRELNEDWKVSSRITSSINLQHVSGGDGSTDYLTFVRN